MDNKELKDIYHRLIVTYFDCQERVAHEVIIKSLNEILRDMEPIVDKYTIPKHEL